MYVCMYVCKCLFMYVREFMHLCIYACICLYMYVGKKMCGLEPTIYL